MQTILLVSSCTIIIVILIALFFKSYPSIKKWFTTGKVNYFWLIVIFLVIFIFLTFPVFFSLWAKYFWNMNSESIESFGKLGPLGDIYGSLNAFVSSVALCAVAYSTWLQITSLQETRVANAKQVVLAEKVHNEQLNETKINNFQNLFYALLNHKQVKLYQLKTKKGEIEFDANNVFLLLSQQLGNLLKKDWIDTKFLTTDDIRKEFIAFCREQFSPNFYASIHSYFLIYGDLIDLIKRSEISEEDKIFFKRIVSNSMTGPEQICLLWITFYRQDLHNSLKDSQIFNLFYSDLFLPISRNFLDKTYFKNSKFLENWDKTLNQTPT